MRFQRVAFDGASSFQSRLVRGLPVAQDRLQQNGNGLDLLNFFTLPVGAPDVRADLRADLRAEYTVLIPAGNLLQMVNAYGRTGLADLSGRQTLEQTFEQMGRRPAGAQRAPSALAGPHSWPWLKVCYNRYVSWRSS